MLLQQLFDGTKSAVLICPDGQQQVATFHDVILIPGSFHPLHAGHLALAELAQSRIARPVIFELCIQNVDKNALDYPTVLERVRQFAWKHFVCVSRLSTFVQKSQHFHGSIFVVGADTAQRVLMPKYYKGGALGCKTALAQIRNNRCKFLVAARRSNSQHILTMDDLDVAKEYRALFQQLPIEQFLFDISSTQIRTSQAQRWDNE